MMRNVFAAFLLFFSQPIFFGSISFVYADSCDCPADPNANPSCGPMPALSFAEKTFQPGKHPFCSDPKLNKSMQALLSSVKKIESAQQKKEAKSKYNELVQQMAEDSKKHSDMSSKKFTGKPDSELLDYLYCYANKDQFCHFKETLSPFLKKASEVSKFPYATEACLIFKESSFDPKDVARKTAVNIRAGVATRKIPLGEAQIMPDSVDQLNEVLSKTQIEYSKMSNADQIKLDQTEASIDLKSAEIERSKKNLKNSNLKEQAVLKKKIERDTKDVAELDKHANEVSADKIRVDAKLASRKAWDDYWGPGVWPQGKDKAHQLTPEMMSCPQIAMIAAEAKKVDDYYSIDDHYVKKKKKEVVLHQTAKGEKEINKMGPGEAAIVMSTIYNHGLGLLDKCFPASNLATCYVNLVHNLPSTSEALREMKGIRNCAQRYSFDPTQEGSGHDWDPKECEKLKCDN